MEIEPTLSAWQAIVHDNARSKGWWEEDRSDGELIALIHSELSELLEALREGNPRSAKCPSLSAAEEEAADVMIRLMDMAQARGWSLQHAVAAKAQYNTTRPRKHGKKF